MKHRVLLLSALLSLTASQAGWAQTNFRPGYVVSLTGDTLRGEVDARGAQRNARLSRFRAAPTAAVTEYQPRQLRGYGLTAGQVYQAATVALADSGAVKASGVRDTLQRSSFLEVIVRGPATLLYLRDEIGLDHYYLRMQAGPVQELVQTSQKVTVGGKSFQQKVDLFKRTFDEALRGCPAVQPTIVTMRYAASDFTKLVRAYNTCVGGTSAVPAAASRRTYFTLGMLAGAESSKLLIRTPATSGATEVTMKSGLRPTLGLALQLHLTGVSQTLSARLEALYEQQKYSAFKDNRNDRGFGTQEEYRVALNSIRVPLLVRYTFPRGVVRPFAQLGVGLNYYTKVESESRTRQAFGPTINPYQAWKPTVEKPRQFEQGLVGGLGISTARPNARHLALELRYDVSNGYSNQGGTETSPNRLFVLLSYDLTK